MGDLDFTVHSAVKSSPKFTFRNKLPNEDQIKKNTNPGPGQHPMVPTDLTKYRSVPAWGIGSPEFKNKDRGYEKCPGPGAYSPPLMDSAAPQRWGFGPGFGTKVPPRFGKRSNSAPAPIGPGQYETRRTLGDDAVSSAFSGKIEGPKGVNVPGPGKYDASIVGISETPPRPVMGKSLRQDLKDKGKSPAPGAYRAECMMNGGITKRASPKFTMMGRPQDPVPKHQGPKMAPAASTFK